MHYASSRECNGISDEAALGIHSRWMYQWRRFSRCRSRSMSFSDSPPGRRWNASETMSFGRALYHTVWRRNHLPVLLVLLCLAFMMVLLQQSKIVFKKAAMKRLHYELLPPSGEVADIAWWQNQSGGHEKKTLQSTRRKLFHDPKAPPAEFVSWRKDALTGCDGNFNGYGNKFLRLQNVVLDRNYLVGRKGGEEIKAVINQTEEAEYHRCSYGCFQLACSDRPAYYFAYDKNHLTLWLEGLRTSGLPKDDAVDETRNQFTIMIVRYEYANIYHTMTDFYCAFVLMQFFNRTQHDTNILIIDGHPQGQLDPIWDTLFNSSARVSSLNTRTRFNYAVWGIMGYDSGMLWHIDDTLLLLEEFRNFFLSSYNLVTDQKLDCQHLSILFIWRHDYLAHPRNPKGVVSRKIANERELLNFTKGTFPQFQVRGVQIDLFEFKHQLQLVASADILVGMHGAGLTHTVFLPKHAALIELIPSYWSHMSHDHFRALARWRHLDYFQWENENEANELPGSYTNIPTDVLHNLLKKAIAKMCDTKQTTTNPGFSWYFSQMHRGNFRYLR